MKSLWRGWHWYFSGPVVLFFFTPQKYFELFSCYYTQCAAAVAGFPQDAWCSSGFSFPRLQVLISFSLSLPLSPSSPLSECWVTRTTRRCSKPTSLSGESSSRSATSCPSLSASWKSLWWANRAATRSPTWRTASSARWGRGGAGRGG